MKEDTTFTKLMIVTVILALIAALRFMSSVAYANSSPGSPINITSPSSPETTPKITVNSPVVLDQDAEDPWVSLLNPDRDYVRILVNATHPYDFGGAYDQALQADLVSVSDEVYGDEAQVEKAVYYAYLLFKRNLAEQGIIIGLLGSTAGCRTEADQQEVYDLNPEGAFQPGYSEHHTGLVISMAVYLPDQEGKLAWLEPDAWFNERYSDTAYVIRHTAPEYGFVVRYPAGHEEHTGIPATLRELRFVGKSSTAKLITAVDVCMEEYLEQVGS